MNLFKCDTSTFIYANSLTNNGIDNYVDSALGLAGAAILKSNLTMYGRDMDRDAVLSAQLSSPAQLMFKAVFGFHLVYKVEPNLTLRILRFLVFSG